MSDVTMRAGWGQFQTGFSCVALEQLFVILRIKPSDLPGHATN